MGITSQRSSNYILLLLAISSQLPFNSSFVSKSFVFNSKNVILSNDGLKNTFALYAKTAKKGKKKGSASKSSGGGFGAPAPKKASSPKSEKQDDFAAFPPLEPNVKETLVPSTEALATEAGELPDDIYDRLAQVYGFPNFNYLDVEEGQEEEDTNENISFDDLIKSSSTSSSSTSSSLLGTSSKTSDFDDLIAAATGGSTSSKPTPSEEAKVKSKPLPISKLPAFEKFRVLHVDPMVLCIDDFLTDDECDILIAHSDPTSTKNKMNNPTNIHMAPMMSRSKTVGKDANSQAQRTSTTWFHHFQGKEIAPLMAKSCRLLGLDDIDRWEEPQTVRYRGTEKFTWHLDALSPSEDLMAKGGQRTATLLVYLNSLEEKEGESPRGSTMFRDLGIDGEFLKV